MKIMSVVGARPQFIKAAALSRVLRREHEEILIHTGQHYDANMSEVFFKELDVPRPDIHLEIGSGSHGYQTGTMLAALEEQFTLNRPGIVLVYGDTNSTLAGALAAAKLNIPLAHVEAGLRSHRRNMPEEINRVLTDHVSDLLFCPGQDAVDNLRAEGIMQGVYLVGDVMMEALDSALGAAERSSGVLKRLDLSPGHFVLATVHRAQNTDDLDRLSDILQGLSGSNERVIFPVHPRTRATLSALPFDLGPHVTVIEPVGYLDMAMLVSRARVIVTDSGGLQKEAYWLRVPCVTLRDETEWMETVEAGWNILVGADAQSIQHQIRTFRPPNTHPDLYGDGSAAARCVEILSAYEEARTDG